MVAVLWQSRTNDSECSKKSFRLQLLPPNCESGLQLAQQPNGKWEKAILFGRNSNVLTAKSYEFMSVKTGIFWNSPKQMKRKKKKLAAFTFKTYSVQTAANFFPKIQDPWFWHSADKLHFYISVSLCCLLFIPGSSQQFLALRNYSLKLMANQRNTQGNELQTTMWIKITTGVRHSVKHLSVKAASLVHKH